jgi:hypothetical protein
MSTTENNIKSYWAFVKAGTGNFIRVTIQADTPYNALQILKNTYGDNLQSGPALVS